MVNEHNDALARLITQHEGIRYFAYDDHTGEVIKPGSAVQGYPTIGVGRNLATRGLTHEEVGQMLENDLAEVIGTLVHAEGLAWFSEVDAVRAAVMIDLCFNMGWTTLSQFHEFLNFMATRDYLGAANDLAKTAWYTENHGGVEDSRATHAYQMLRSGLWPTSINGPTMTAT